MKPRRGTHHHPTFTLIQERLITIADKHGLDMQNVRFQLILKLKALAELAKKAIDTHPAKEETKQNRTRLAAHVGQVTNGTGKTISAEAISRNTKRMVVEDLALEARTRSNRPVAIMWSS